MSLTISPIPSTVKPQTQVLEAHVLQNIERWKREHEAKAAKKQAEAFKLQQFDKVVNLADKAQSKAASPTISPAKQKYLLRTCRATLGEQMMAAGVIPLNPKSFKGVRASHPHKSQQSK